MRSVLFIYLMQVLLVLGLLHYIYNKKLYFFLIFLLYFCGVFCLFVFGDLLQFFLAAGSLI